MTAPEFDEFVDLLRSKVSGFDRIYNEHVRDYDEVLPHVLVAELVRFLSDEVRTGGEGSRTLAEAMALLEHGMASNDIKLQELIAVSFLENLDPEDRAFPTIKRMLGPHLRDQLMKYEK